ncbi:MAG: chemotaxis protein CheX [Candidatus Aureabacteria bacterium]|nr:chemotaxis protein CheX [Candidatus Auribacterota bacterium]
MLNVEFINPFIQATVNIFKTMVFMEIHREKPYIKKIGQPKADISGTIGLAGKANGVIAVTFAKEVACKITSSMLNEKYTEMNDTVKDSIGEIANMIAGGAKGILSEKGLNFKIALPSVIVGADHTISFPPGVPCMVIPFNIQNMEKPFHVEVCLKTEEEL